MWIGFWLFNHRFFAGCWVTNLIYIKIRDLLICKFLYMSVCIFLYKLLIWQAFVHDKVTHAVYSSLVSFSIHDLFLWTAEIPAALKRLTTNRVFMFHVVAVNFHLLANIGFFAFSPKYLESQFRVSASTSNLAVGTILYIFENNQKSKSFISSLHYYEYSLLILI